MGELTEKRKAELMKQYPDGNAIGRLVIEDYLDGERARRGFPRDKTAIPGGGEIGFLIKTITEEKEKHAYNRCVKFRDAIYSLANMVTCFDNLFFCGHYNVLHLIQPVMMGLDVYRIEPDFLKHERHKNNCRALIGQIEKELKQAWEVTRDGLRGLYLYDFILRTIGEAHRFDFAVIRPDVENRVDGFLNLQDEARNFRDLIADYQQATQGHRGAIRVPKKVISLLNEIERDDYNKLQLPQEAVDAWEPTLREININIPNVQMIISGTTSWRR